MPIDKIIGQFGTYFDRHNRPITMGADETLDLHVAWQDDETPLDITGGYVTAWLVDMDGEETQLPSTIENAAGGIQKIDRDAFTFTRGTYSLVARLTLNGDTRSTRVDLHVQRAVGTLITAPVVIDALQPVTLAGGADDVTIDAGAVISGATSWSVTGPGASIDEAGILTLTAGAVVDGATITVTGSNSEGPVSLSFTYTVTATAPGVQTDGTVTVTDNGDTVTVTFGAPEWTGVPAITAPTLAFSVDGGAPTNPVGASVTIDKTLADLDLSAVWTGDNGTGTPATSTATATVAAIAAPGVMAAPTLTGGVNTATLTFGPAPAENGSPISGYGYEVTSAADTNYVMPAAQGTQADRAAVTLDDPGLGDFIARTWAIKPLIDGPKSSSSNPATVSSGALVTALTEFSRDRTIIDSGFALGQNNAPVVIGGTTDAVAGQIIEARAVSVDDGGATTTAWQDIMTVGGVGSSWFGILNTPRSASWYRVETRVKGSSAQSVTMANRFASGHVWAMWEQSNIAKIFLDFPSNAASLYDAVVDEECLQVVSSAQAGPVLINEANKGSNPCTPAAVSIANAWRALRGGEKLMIGCQAKSGTSLPDALTYPGAEDSTYGGGAQRDFGVDLAIHTAMTADGSHVGTVFIPGWIASHIGKGGAIPEAFFNVATGFTHPGRAKIDLPNVFNAGQGLPRIFPNTLFDGETTDALGASLASGLYDNRVTRHCYLGPHGQEKAVSPAATYATIDDLPKFDAGPDDTYALICANAPLVWNSATHPEVLDYPGEASGAARQDNDRLHFDGGLREGRQRFAVIELYLMASAVGLNPHAVPRLDVRYDEPTGAYADFGISGGVSVTTERTRRAATGSLNGLPADLSLEPGAAPHHTQVIGWHVDKTPVARAEIEVAAGHPVFADGQTFCRVYPNAGVFTYAQNIGYGYGNLPQVIVDEDYALLTSALDGLVADVGQPQEVLPAMPVQFQQNDTLATTLFVPPLFDVSASEFQSSSSTEIQSLSQMVLEIDLRINTPSTNARTVFVQGNNKPPKVLLNRDAEFVMSLGSGTLVLPTSIGTFVKYNFHFDGTNSEIWITDGDGTTVAGPVATGAIDPFGNFGPAKFFKDGVNDYLEASIVKAVVTFGTTVAGGTPTYGLTAQAGAPFYTSTGALNLIGAAPTQGVA